jgi:hypothetical protein
LRKCDKRAAAVVRGTDQADEIDIAKKGRIARSFTGEHYQAEPSGAEQFVHGAKRVHAALRTHEKRTLFPERPGDRAGDIDPRRTIAVCNRSVARGAHDGSRAAAGLPDGQPAKRKSTTRESAIELRDPRGHPVGGVLRDLNSVGKTLFKQGSECSDLGRHGVEMIPNKHRNNKRQKPPAEWNQPIRLLLDFDIYL